MGFIKTFLRHAVGPRTSSSMFISGVSGYHAVANMHLLMDDPMSVGTLIAFLLAGLFSWAVIISDSYKADRRDSSIENMESMLNTLVARLPDDSVQIPPALANLSELSNLQIKIGVDNLVKKLRAFGTKAKMRQAEQISGRPHFFNKTEEERLAIWNEQNAKYVAISEELASEFNNVYRPEALAYRDDMRRRLGIIDPKTDYRDVALEHGMLAGVNPINDAANALEKLARELL
jgi:hypothetical protein